MAGTKTGGMKCVETNKNKHGKDYYKELGILGGKVRHPNKGFGSNRELARIAGKKGGEVSRRGKNHES